MAEMQRNYLGRTGTTDVAIDVGLREHMLRVYNYMASGLALTGIAAYLVANTGLVSVFFQQTATGQIAPTILGWIGMLAPLNNEAPDLLDQISNQLGAAGFDRQVFKVSSDNWNRKVVTGQAQEYDLLIGKWSFGLVEDVNDAILFIDDIHDARSVQRAEVVRLSA